MIDLKREEADAVGYTTERYDALLTVRARRTGGSRHWCS